jgi:uncharacterized protein YndB with AHSA1/START domain
MGIYLNALAIVVGAIAVWILFWLPPWFRTRRVASTVVIQRSPEVVFNFVSDFRNLPRWFPNIEQVEMLTIGPIGPGTRFREHGHLPSGRPFQGDDEIMEFEPNRRLTSRVPTARRPALDVITVEPVGASARLAHELRMGITISSALRGAMLPNNAIYRSMMVRRQEASERIKALLESSEFDQRGS